jgi:hypothetical protein
VALVVPLYQTHAASTRLRLHTRLSPTLEAVADAIREARRAGLEVTLFPIVRLSDPRTPDEWRGTLQPADADAWFASYGEHLGDLASLANLTGATRLVVGSELSTLDGDLARWQHLITLIRAVFSGTLVYSANWDHYRDARLFELVDEIGVVGYFSLRDAKAPSDVATLATSWRRIGRELDADLSKYRRAVGRNLGRHPRSRRAAARLRGLPPSLHPARQLAPPHRRPLHLELVRLWRPRHHQLHPARQAGGRHRPTDPARPRPAVTAASTTVREIQPNCTDRFVNAPSIHQPVMGKVVLGRSSATAPAATRTGA